MISFVTDINVKFLASYLALQQPKSKYIKTFFNKKKVYLW